MGRVYSPVKKNSNGWSRDKIIPVGYLGDFGEDMWRMYDVPGTYQFVVPDNVSKIRVRVVGAGGAGYCSASTAFLCIGGGGGGYAHGVFSVTEGTSYNLTVGLGGTIPQGNVAQSGQSGGTSSFGALISATGGAGGAAGNNSAGGTGIGGDFQASGGIAMLGSAISGGGGGAGSQLGRGGNSSATNNWGGGGGVGGGNGALGGGSAFGNAFGDRGGPDVAGRRSTSAQAPFDNAIGATFRFPFEGFLGGGGSGGGGANGFGFGTSGGGGGGGAPGAERGGHGGVGGGGGGGYPIRTGAGTYGGNGGIGGGGGGSVGIDGQIWAGNGGHGLVIVEW